MGGIAMTRKEALDWITKKVLGIDTLETQHSDEKDFHEVSVWNLKRTLEAMYDEGFNAANLE